MPPSKTNDVVSNEVYDAGLEWLTKPEERIPKAVPPIDTKNGELFLARSPTPYLEYGDPILTCANKLTVQVIIIAVASMCLMIFLSKVKS